MWLFLSILFILGFFITTTNFSLLTRSRYRLLWCGVISAASFAVFPLAIKLNIQTLNRLMNDFSILSFVCTYQIVEAILFGLLSLRLITGHYAEKGNMLLKLLSLLPAGIFLAGLFFLQTYLFNMVSGMAFQRTAFLFSIGLFLLLYLGATGLKKLLPDWEWRMEIKTILSFFQVMLAMFLPLIVRGVTVRQSPLAFEIKTMFITLVAMAVIAAVGYLIRVIKIRRVVAKVQ